jgi:hypothetical protein
MKNQPIHPETSLFGTNLRQQTITNAVEQSTLASASEEFHCFVRNLCQENHTTDPYPEPD